MQCSIWTNRWDEHAWQSSGLFCNHFPNTPRNHSHDSRTALTGAQQTSTSWSRSNHYMHLHTSWRSILILSSHLWQGLPIGLLPSDFPTKTQYAPLSSPIHATCPAHLILEEPKNIHWGVQIINLLIMYSPLLCYLIPLTLSAIFLNTFRLRFALRMRDQVSHPYNTAAKLEFCTFMNSNNVFT